jgi:nucleoside-diphosphate-sugar epimerase
LIGEGYPGVGTPTNKQDYAYVENVVHAFFKLEEKLTPGSPAAGQVCASSSLPIGPTCKPPTRACTNKQAYFISDDAPVRYLDFAKQFGRRFGHTFRIIPHHLATVLAHIVEFLTRLSKYWPLFLSFLFISFNCTFHLLIN